MISCNEKRLAEYTFTCGICKERVYSFKEYMKHKKDMHPFLSSCLHHQFEGLTCLFGDSCSKSHEDLNAKNRNFLRRLRIAELNSMEFKCDYCGEEIRGIKLFGEHKRMHKKENIPETRNSTSSGISSTKRSNKQAIPADRSSRTTNSNSKKESTVPPCLYHHIDRLPKCGDKNCKRRHGRITEEERGTLIKENAKMLKEAKFTCKTCKKKIKGYFDIINHEKHHVMNEMKRKKEMKMNEKDPCLYYHIDGLTCEDGKKCKFSHKAISKKELNALKAKNKQVLPKLLSTVAKAKPILVIGATAAKSASVTKAKPAKKKAPVSVSAGAKPTKCDACGITFLSKRAFLAHKPTCGKPKSKKESKGKTNKNTTIKVTAAVAAPKEKKVTITPAIPSKCTFCGEEFPSKKSLTKHMKNDHAEEHQAALELKKTKEEEAK
eukprot:TRINITY_DN55690_c0_g1_i1.p1 TRINITY_DN55690_c0_g1~~TRINITY_DN55690_c0_g1_i1.p1  ORF type:complete len:489 (+),score=112.83 TRINITY_DN55690_c0_g1_i1:164-1468(+)